MSDELIPANAGEFLFYQTEDGQVRLQVRIEAETVWLTQKQMADLFQTTKQNVSLHIQNIFEEGELLQAATVKQYLIVQTEGSRQVEREVEHYNLDVIISVGYRVKSLRGTQFRIWATQRLRELIVKGFTMDDDRLKNAGGGNYFEELLERIRDIRSSERVFWRKVLDIYATSIDYDGKAETSRVFFSTVQNKMHWAVHGQTAAEVIHRRADANKPNMGLTTWAGDRPRKADVSIAKNYLSEEELQALNLIVSAYLDFAELQARSHKPMYMADWGRKLDDFLRVADRQILTHSGVISHDAAVAKAEAELGKYREAQAALPQPVDRHFEQTLGELEKLEGEAQAQVLPAPKSEERKKKPARKKKPQAEEGK
jgi:hypothetical protein